MTDPKTLEPVAFTLMCPECETGKMVIDVKVTVQVSVITITIPSVIWSRTIRGAEIVSGPDNVIPSNDALTRETLLACSNPECEYNGQLQNIIDKWRTKGHPHLLSKEPKD